MPLNMRLRMQLRSATVEKMAGIFTKCIWQPVPDLPIGYIGLSLGPQDRRGASNKLWNA